MTVELIHEIGKWIATYMTMLAWCYGMFWKVEKTENAVDQMVIAVGLTIGALCMFCLIWDKP